MFLNIADNLFATTPRSRTLNKFISLLLDQSFVIIFRFHANILFNIILFKSIFNFFYLFLLLSLVLLIFFCFECILKWLMFEIREFSWFGDILIIYLLLGWFYFNETILILINPIFFKKTFTFNFEFVFFWIIFHLTKFNFCFLFKFIVPFCIHILTLF